MSRVPHPTGGVLGGRAAPEAGSLPARPPKTPPPPDNTRQTYICIVAAGPFPFSPKPAKSYEATRGGRRHHLHHHRPRPPRASSPRVLRTKMETPPPLQNYTQVPPSSTASSRPCPMTGRAEDGRARRRARPNTSAYEGARVASYKDSRHSAARSTFKGTPRLRVESEFDPGARLILINSHPQTSFPASTVLLIVSSPRRFPSLRSDEKRRAAHAPWPQKPHHRRPSPAAATLMLCV